MAAGTLAVAGSLQQIYEKAFRQEHRGIRGYYRLLIWTIVLCLVLAFESDAGRPLRNASAGAILTWFVAIGAALILGAVAGVVWADRKGR
jgi:hypothetical protein